MEKIRWNCAGNKCLNISIRTNIAPACNGLAKVKKMQITCARISVSIVFLLNDNFADFPQIDAYLRLNSKDSPS